MVLAITADGLGRTRVSLVEALEVAWIDSILDRHEHVGGGEVGNPGHAAHVREGLCLGQGEHLGAGALEGMI